MLSRTVVSSHRAVTPPPSMRHKRICITFFLVKGDGWYEATASGWLAYRHSYTERTQPRNTQADSSTKRKLIVWNLKIKRQVTKNWQQKCKHKHWGPTRKPQGTNHEHRKHTNINQTNEGNEVQVERRREQGSADEAAVRQVWSTGTQVSRRWRVTTRNKRIKQQY